MISFNTNLIKETNKETIYNTSIEEVHFNRSLEFVSEVNTAYREATMNLYSKFQSSESEEIVNEAFDEFYNTIKSIIDKMISFVNSQYNTFYISFQKQIRESSGMKINNIDNYLNHEIMVDRFIFTNLEAELPKNKAKTSFEIEYGKIKEILNDKKTSSQKLSDLTIAYELFVDDIKNEFYDQFRGEIIKSKTPIRSSEFAMRIFDSYRNGGKSVNTRIPLEEVKEINKRFGNYHNLIKEVKKDKDNVAKEYEQIKSDLSDISFTKICGKLGNNAEEIQDRYNMYIKAKIDQILNMSNIHIMVFNGKLDAVSSAYVQDKKIIKVVSDICDAVEAEKKGV